MIVVVDIAAAANVDAVDRRDAAPFLDARLRRGTAVLDATSRTRRACRATLPVIADVEAERRAVVERRDVARREA